MTPNPSLPPPPTWAELAQQPCALFLDVDGTLLEFESHPDLVRATEGLIRLLRAVESALDGALALVSGRSLADLDRVFAPWRPVAAGVHGAEVRAPSGTRRHEPDARLTALLRAGADEVARRVPGVWVEDKGASVALHHRGAPEAAEALQREVDQLMGRLSEGFEVQPGVLVQEIRPLGWDKGRALQELMAEAPYRGRRPVVVGDDRTDEYAFTAAQEQGGLAVLVGTRADTVATHRLPDPAAVRGWLAELVEEVHA